MSALNHYFMCMLVQFVYGTVGVWTRDKKTKTFVYFTHWTIDLQFAGVSGRKRKKTSPKSTSQIKWHCCLLQLLNSIKKSFYLRNIVLEDFAAEAGKNNRCISCRNSGSKETLSFWILNITIECGHSDLAGSLIKITNGTAQNEKREREKKEPRYSFRLLNENLRGKACGKNEHQNE